MNEVDLVETESYDWRVLWVSGCFKPTVFENLNVSQKINHFPGSTELTHKDRLAFNIRKKKQKYGADYDIIPETFILPEEYDKAFTKIKNEGGLWISKPYSQSQGKGIYLVIDPQFTKYR